MNVDFVTMSLTVETSYISTSTLYTYDAIVDMHRTADARPPA